jgi:endonuclease/exonuclease/phosphatase family metal-dependent hydrolase
MGMDLALTFSPLNEQGQGRGARVEIVTPSGELVSLPPASLDLITAPTHASDWFEARLARRLPGEGLLPVPGLLSTGRAAGRVVLLGPGGRLLAAADPFRVELVPAAAQPRRATLEIPPRPVGALRVVSLNVENSAPDTTPEPFTRMLRVLDPDVVLIQEWYDQTPETLQTWFNSHMPIAGTWSAVTSQGRGVAVVSRLPIEPLGPGGVSIATDDDVRTVRSASALVQTPGGPVALTSVHLKCCGSVGSPEDQQRQIEARAIAGMLADALGQTQAVGVVIGGDLNLVGGVEPLTLLGEGLDPAGGFLRTAEPMVLGEPVMYTWTDPASEFLPGRLDYVLYSGSAMELQRAAVLDPARLSDPVLLATNVQPTDGAASDHRPVVCDFRFRSPQAR